MWIILNKEFYDAELRDCRAVSAYDDLDNAKEGLKRLVDNLPEYKNHLLNNLEWQNDMSFVIGDRVGWCDSYFIEYVETNKYL
jgi:hypothetical protein